MSDAKHTPGPWKAHATNKARSGVTEYEIHWSDDGECVAEIVHGAPDAHLIAAAPEMLNALKELKERFGEIANYAHNTQGPVCSGDMRAIGAQMADIWRDVGEPAVAKAEGRTE